VRDGDVARARVDLDLGVARGRLRQDAEQALGLATGRALAEERDVGRRGRARGAGGGAQAGAAVAEVGAGAHPPRVVAREGHHEVTVAHHEEVRADPVRGGLGAPAEAEREEGLVVRRRAFVGRAKRVGLAADEAVLVAEGEATGGDVEVHVVMFGG
jgi:hypothetical protein